MRTKRIFGLALSILLVAALCSSSATAAVWFVDRNAPAGGSGTSWNSPFNMVQTGINAAVSGDEVWVKHGTYYENIVLRDGVALYGHFIGNESTVTERLLSDPSADSILDGGQIDVVVLISSCPSPLTRVDGFTIRNGNEGGICCSLSPATITNNVITGNTAAWGGGIYASACSPLIYKNHISNNIGSGIFLGPSTSNTVISHNIINGNSTGLGGGIFAGNAGTNILIYGNVLRGNYASAQYGGGGIYLYDTTASIVNNTIVQNASTTYGGGITVDRAVQSTVVTAANNVIAFGSSGIFVSPGALLTLAHNNVFGNTAYNYSGISQGATDLSADPLFINLDAGDTHLTASSPCINAGDNSFVRAEDVDIDGEPRVNSIDGTHLVDIGADAFYYPETSMAISGTLGENGWYVSIVTVTLSSTAATGKTIASIQYALGESSTWISYIGPFTVSAQGPTTVNYFAVDNTGFHEAIKLGSIAIDTVNPAVDRTTPPIDSLDVPLNTQVLISFSENIQAGTNYSNITLTRNNSPASITPRISGNTLALNNRSLTKNSTYAVTIPAGAIKDLAGNPLAANFTYSFKTEK